MVINREGLIVIIWPSHLNESIIFFKIGIIMCEKMAKEF